MTTPFTCRYCDEPRPDHQPTCGRLACADKAHRDTHHNELLHLDPHALRARVLADRFGFLSAAELALLAADDTARLWQCLVRCGGCRFVAATQDVAFLIRAIELAGDYVRDVAILPAGGR
jgi:hypothetical protein